MKYAILALAVIAFGCHVTIGSSERIDGNGVIKKESRNITGFKDIEVDGPFEVELIKGNSYSVEIEADENLMRYISITKEDGELEISEEDDVELHSRQAIKVRVQMPMVNDVVVAGSGSVKSETVFENPDAMAIKIGGSGNVTLELKSPKVDVEIGGSGQANLSGSTRKLDISIGGSGDCLAEELLSEECKVSIGGSGTAKVFASVGLNVSIGGSGNVYYRGEPKNIQKSIGGSGSVEQIK